MYEVIGNRLYLFGGQAFVGNVTQNSRRPAPDSAATAPALTTQKRSR
jgi:hypothetical protein